MSKAKAGKDGDKKSKAKPPPGLGASELWESLEAKTKAQARQAGLLNPDVKSPLLQMLSDHIEQAEEDELPPTQLVVSFPLSAPWLAAFLKGIKAAFTPVGYTGLTSLCFWNAGFGDAGAAVLANALAEMPLVWKLEAIDCGITHEGCEALGKYLRKRAVARLRILRLDHNDIGVVGVQHLMDALYFNSTLTELSLSYCNIGAAAAPYMSATLQAKDVNIATLNLKHNSLQHKGFIDLADGIAGSKTLTNLDLSENNVAADDDIEQVLQPFCTALCTNVQLHNVNLVGNLLGARTDYAVLYMQRALAEAKHLWKVDVTPFMGGDVYKTFTEMIEANKPAPDKKKKKKKATKKE